MVYIRKIDTYEDKNGNRIIFSGTPIEENISVLFRGKNNTLIVNKNARIKRLSIRFDQDNGTFEIDKNEGKVAAFQGIVRIGQDSTVRIGMNVSTTNAVQISAVEGTTISIGDDVMIAGDVKVRGDDGHPIFDVRTNKRINPARNITVGNHVWLGIESILFGGSSIGEGSVVGARSVVTKDFPNNCIIAGTPASIVRRNIAWERPHLSLTNPPYKNSGDDIPKTDYWNITVDL
ncbi:acyltransferase [Rothia aerolata]|uniref:Acyltransferase n=1 Tax=Rothia aerolata TaxID=1812262 RepID=A0A917IWV0_9MICC|nr:acyltransferase [Rothia aerolata]GGH65086.1 hypothetical protein GCM10007359_17980 [Rothia aerolata]